MRPRAVAAALAALAALALGVPRAQAVISDFYGVNAGGLVFGLAPAERDRHLAAMRDAGISVVRVDASWAAAEPAPPGPDGTHTYTWGKFDDMAAAMARSGLRWYPMLGYSTSWSGTQPPDMMSPPADPGDYAAFVSAFAKRYGRAGTFWSAHPELPQLPVVSYEIWNEPNFVRFWTTQRDAAERYAELYARARSAVHDVDPAAQAVVGGLVDFGGAAFVRRMYAHRPELRGNVDAVGFHPYRQLRGVLGTIADLRRAMVAVGDGAVPIEITEIGWPVGSRPEGVRARMLLRLTRTLPQSGLGVTRLIPYVWTGDPEWNIVNPDTTMMAPGAAYAAGIKAMTGPQTVALDTAPALCRVARRAAALRARCGLSARAGSGPRPTSRR